MLDTCVVNGLVSAQISRSTSPLFSPLDDEKVI